jgi:hypothetical protein
MRLVFLFQKQVKIQGNSIKSGQKNEAHQS